MDVPVGAAHASCPPFFTVGRILKSWAATRSRASSTVPMSCSRMRQRTTWGEALIPAPRICVHRELTASGAQNVCNTCNTRHAQCDIDRDSESRGMSCESIRNITYDYVLCIYSLKHSGFKTHWTLLKVSVAVLSLFFLSIRSVCKLMKLWLCIYFKC